MLREMNGKIATGENKNYSLQGIFIRTKACVTGTEQTPAAGGEQLWKVRIVVRGRWRSFFSAIKIFGFFVQIFVVAHGGQVYILHFRRSPHGYIFSYMSLHICLLYLYHLHFPRLYNTTTAKKKSNNCSRTQNCLRQRDLKT